MPERKNSVTHPPDRLISPPSPWRKLAHLLDDVISAAEGAALTASPPAAARPIDEQGQAVAVLLAAKTTCHGVAAGVAGAAPPFQLPFLRRDYRRLTLRRRRARCRVSSGAAPRQRMNPLASMAPRQLVISTVCPVIAYQRAGGGGGGDGQWLFHFAGRWGQTLTVALARH